MFPIFKNRIYSRAPKKFQSSDRRYQFGENKRIRDIRASHCNGALEIKSWYATARVEKELRSLFGLNAQIFRRDEKKGWVQTSLSDDFTLAQQSRFGL